LIINFVPFPASPVPPFRTLRASLREGLQLRGETLPGRRHRHPARRNRGLESREPLQTLAYLKNAKTEKKKKTPEGVFQQNQELLGSQGCDRHAYTIIVSIEIA
jgi:hypothetical protein